jgi:recombination protein RecT
MTEMVPYEVRMKTLNNNLNKLSAQFASVLPPSLPAKKLIRVIRTVVQNTPKLLDADPRTLLAACVQCAQLGLSPDPMLGEAYMVPYRGSVKLIPGYKGLRNLAFNHERVVGMYAAAVHENDTFEFDEGSEPFVKHRFSLTASRGEIIGAYARVELKDARWPVLKVLDREFLEKIKKSSQSRDRSGKLVGPWVDWEEGQAAKTAIKQVVKFIPASSELRRAVSLDDQAESGQEQGLDEVLQPQPAGDSSQET